MVFGKHAVWRKIEKQHQPGCAVFPEDPFELAIEEASLKLLRSVCSIFQWESAAVLPLDCTTERHVSSVENSGCTLRREGRLRNNNLGVSHEFPASSIVLPAVDNVQHTGNGRERVERSADGGCGNKSTTRSYICQDAREAHVRVRECSSGQSQTCERVGNGPNLRRKEADDGIYKYEREAQQPPGLCAMASLTLAPAEKYRKEQEPQEINHPSTRQLLSHPLALLSYVPRDVALFFAGAVAGATAKTVTAPLDRIKLLMQVHGLRATQEIKKGSIGFLEAAVRIGKEEGIQGYWKGNLPQVIRVIPYSAVQLLSYELYKKLFKGQDKELSVVGRLAAGACAGMTSTLVTYPLDVLRLRLAVDPSCHGMVQVVTTILREEGLSSFYRGLGPSLLGIAPYIALNFCAFDLIKKSLPEDVRKTPAASFLTAVLSASLATATCYPLDTVRRQLQMKGTPYVTILDAIPGIVAKDGVLGLYRGFVPNALKNLPNSSIRLTTFDGAKSLIHASQQEFQRLLDVRRGVSGMFADLSTSKKS
ncbi:hypothetical protein KP509_33G049000 [Ceratopteris richardii]|uniref:Uncharacterized protein n=1 Tax=Ceratopteris richardii TaxID=49495 RepID=A0A8T2QQL1_CERRI|nr:hypothetical protein KP509_33G049000 [Ceratopteris richardii]